MSVATDIVKSLKAARERARQANRTEQHAAREFIQEWREAIGLEKRNEHGVLESVRDEFGNPAIARGSIDPGEVSVQEMAHLIGGRDLFEHLTPNYQASTDHLVMEAGSDPTVGLQSSVYRASIAGLLDVKILQKYQESLGIGQQLMMTEPTNRNGEKEIGVGRLSTRGMDAQLVRKPGERHTRLDFGDQWIETPETVEKSAAIDLLQERVYFDKTSEVLSEAAAIGERLGRTNDRDKLRVVLGIVNNHKYNGTSYNTFQAGPTPWANSQVNPNTNGDYTSLDAAWKLWNEMKDPSSGDWIDLSQDGMVILRDKSTSTKWDFTLSRTETRQTVGGITQIIAGGTSSSSKEFQMMDSNEVRNLLMTERSLSEANARGWWGFGNPRKAFAYKENWPLRLQQAPPSNYEMIDRGIVASYFTNYRGVAFTRDPRYWHEQKNA